MTAHADIHRSIAKMTIDLTRMMHKRQRAGDLYKLAEREYQTQYEFKGKLGTLPVESDIDIDFDVVFLFDAGNMRDSQHDRPQARMAIEMLERPAGAIAYAHVKQWKQDDDFNFTGARVTVGVHCPALYAAYVGGPMPTSYDFHGILHAAFQGYGAPWDADLPDGSGWVDPSQDIGVG